MPEHVLVTGGAGYIGSHTCKVLAESGMVPVALDNLSRGNRGAVRWGPLIEADIADAGAVRQTIERFGIRSMIHFAAYAYVGESMQSPEMYFHNNAAKSVELLRSALDCGVEHVVFSSTCAVYGAPGRVPISEEEPQRPENPYGESKLFIERVLKWFGATRGLRWVALRYFNAAGADPAAGLGEQHEPETHLIPLAIGAALGTQPHLQIYGSDYPTADGTAIRDYVHVLDLADAHVRALQYSKEAGNETVFNLGTGSGYSVREVVAAVEARVGRSVATVQVGRRPGDPPVLVADPGRARRVLGWQPRHSGLPQIVDSAFAWHASQAAARPGSNV